MPFALSKAPEVERVDALMVIFDLVQEELTLGVVLAACHLASSSHERSKRTDAGRLWYKIYVFRDNDGQTMKAVFSAPPKCQRGLF